MVSGELSTRAACTFLKEVDSSSSTEVAPHYLWLQALFGQLGAGIDYGSDPIPCPSHLHPLINCLLSSAPTKSYIRRISSTQSLLHILGAGGVLSPQQTRELLRDSPFTCQASQLYSCDDYCPFQKIGISLTEFYQDKCFPTMDPCRDWSIVLNSYLLLCNANGGGIHQDVITRNDINHLNVCPCDYSCDKSWFYPFPIRMFVVSTHLNCSVIL